MIAPEFSRPVDPARLGAGTVHYDIVANQTERAALAARFGLVSLDRFEARVGLRRVPGNMVRLDASLVADLVQTDIVTLDPISNHVADDFSLLFAEEAGDAEALDPAAEVVESVIDGRIDIGEAVAQQLSLAIDPYPRATDPATPIELP